ncbi:MAG: diguanylate cyclase [Gemmatimonadota bacterium]
MSSTAQLTVRPVPPRALALSLLALAVPVAAALLWPQALGEQGALLWLLALVPAFLLAYYRGWRGVATALALGMATLSLTQVVSTWLGHSIPDLLFGIVVAYLFISMGIGWVTELLHRDRADVEDLALTDILTRLPNRRHARVFLENEFGAAERGRLLSAVLFDLDHFKEYNDQYGHQAGDEALQAFGDILTETTRRMNLSARFGGEEFVSILAGSDGEGALAFAERVRIALKNKRLPVGALTVSAGVAAYHPSMRAPDELLAAADHALYRAKREGRNCVRLFGRPLLERDTPQQAEPDLEYDPHQEPQGEYPREGADVGRTQAPVTLIPHQLSGFGRGRRVLLVEDEESVRELVRTYLKREHFQVEAVGDAPSALRKLGAEYELVVTDLRLPGPSGTELVRAVKSRWPRSQVLVITGLREAEVMAEALAAGADAYLMKPFGMPELRAELADALARYDRARDAGEPDGSPLSADGKGRHETPHHTATVKGLLALAEAMELREPYMAGHGERVARYALELARAAGILDGTLNAQELDLACRLHDLGRLGIPATLFGKKGDLDPDEIRQVREHPRIGRRIVEPVLDMSTVLAVVSWHHERWDGTGYPDGLAGESIPLEARLVALVDALDAMTSPRPHRQGLPWSEAIARLRGVASQQFDPGLLAPLQRALPELKRIHDDALLDGRDGPKSSDGLLSSEPLSSDSDSSV